MVQPYPTGNLALAPKAVPATGSIAPDSGHVGFLDGIRGGAALWVLVSHCMIWGGWTGIALPSPKIAVDIFMIVSGFLMMLQYTRREHTEPPDSIRTTLRFWARRFFRIAPVYYVLLLYLFIFWNQHSHGLSVLQHASPQRWAAPEAAAYDVTKYDMTVSSLALHGTFLFGLIPKYVGSSLSPDWSIGLEMQFYAMFPLLFLIFRRTSWFVLLVCGVSASVGCNHLFAEMPGIFPGLKGLYPEPSFLLMKLPLFLIGMMVAHVFCNVEQKPRECAFMTILSVLLACHYSLLTGSATAVICYFGWSRLFGRLKDDSAIRIHRWLNNLFSNRCSVLMADASYSVYLTHCVLISSFGGLLFQQPQFLSLNPSIRVAILTALVIPTSYLLAWLLYRFVEQPGIQMGKRFVNRWLTTTATFQRTV